jgi:hypothetical protein
MDHLHQDNRQQATIAVPRRVGGASKWLVADIRWAAETVLPLIP